MKEPLPPVWQAKVRAELDEQAHAIDAATQSRLNRARQAALAQMDNPSKGWWAFTSCGWTPIWGGALATTVCAWVVLALWPGADAELEMPPVTSATDSELLADQAEPEFFGDLEFYTWLAEEGLEAGQAAADAHEA